MTKKPRVTNQTKAGATLTLAGVATALLTAEATKRGVPEFYSAPIAAAVVGYLGLWAGKLIPH